MTICKYKTGELSGLECPCVCCKAIRKALLKYEAEGKIHIVGTEEDKEMLRGGPNLFK